MEQVAQVEQFEGKNMFFGLNKMDSWGKKAHFHVIKYYMIILTQEGEKNVSSGTEDSSSLFYFLTSKCLTTAT